MITLQLSAAARAIDGQLRGADLHFNGVSTDTRSLRRGQLFFALRGPNGVETVGGIELKRSSVLTGNLARFTTDLRSLVPEIPATEAELATKAQRRIAAEESLIRAPL